MRACTTANAIFVGLALAAVAFAACSGSTPPSQTQSPDPSATDPKSDPPATTSTEPGASTSPPAAKPPQKTPETVADCKELITVITNDPPPGAIPMNNATVIDGGTDGGTSERLRPLTALIVANRDKFRCCFDLWARNNPRAAGRVVLKVAINPEGALMKSEIIDRESTVLVPEVHACMIEVAKSLTYPKSQKGLDTTYTHRFDFKARH